MVKATDDEAQRRSIRRDQLFGIELQPYMFTIATTNMILRGDGKSNLHNLDFLKQNTSQLQLKGCTVGMMNPPYSQGSKKNHAVIHGFARKEKDGSVYLHSPDDSCTSDDDKNNLKFHSCKLIILYPPKEKQKLFLWGICCIKTS